MVSLARTRYTFIVVHVHMLSLARTRYTFTIIHVHMLSLAHTRCTFTIVHVHMLSLERTRYTFFAHEHVLSLAHTCYRPQRKVMFSHVSVILFTISLLDTWSLLILAGYSVTPCYGMVSMHPTGILSYRPSAWHILIKLSCTHAQYGM